MVHSSISILHIQTLQTTPTHLYQQIQAKKATPLRGSKPMRGQRNSQILPSFARIKNKVVADNQAIAQKMQANSSKINQMFEMCRVLTDKSTNSVNTLCKDMEELVKIVERYQPRNEMVKIARNRIGSEMNEWANIEYQLNERSFKIIESAQRPTYRSTGAKIPLVTYEQPMQYQQHQQQYTPSVRVSRIRPPAQALPESRVQAVGDFDLGEVGNDDILSQTMNQGDQMSIDQKEGYSKYDLQLEYQQIKQFVRDRLTDEIVSRPDGVLMKKVILNMYMIYNNEIKRKLLIENTGQLQMELTNQIKMAFPDAKSEREKFRGLILKSNNKEAQTLHDRIEGSIADDGNFQQKYIDPVDELLRQHQDAIDGYYPESLNKVAKVEQ